MAFTLTRCGAMTIAPSGLHILLSGVSTRHPHIMVLIKFTTILSQILQYQYSLLKDFIFAPPLMPSYSALLNLDN